MQPGAFLCTTTTLDPAHAARRPSEAILAPIRGESMQDRASELRRMHLPRTWVNKGMKEGQGVAAPALPSCSELQ